MRDPSKPGRKQPRKIPAAKPGVRPEKPKPEDPTTTETLQLSMALLQNYLENAPDGIYMIDMKGNFLYANRKAEAMTGYDRFELIGKSFSELNILPEKSLRRAVEMLEETNKGRPPTGSDELEIINRDGRIVPVEISTSVVRYKNTQIVLGFVRDITERRQAAQALNESEERYRLLFEDAIEGIVRTTLDGRPVMINAAMARMLGYDSPQDAFAKVTDIKSQVYANPEDREAVIDRLMREGKVTGAEVLLKRQDGSTVNVIINLRLVDDKHGSPVFVEGSCIDITDRYLAEEAVKASEEKYRNIFDNATEGIYQTTPDGRYLSMNPAFATMFGYASPQEMIDGVTNIGQQIYVDPADRKGLAQRLREYGKVDGYEVEVYRKDGSTFWISINAHTVQDASGNILYFEGTNEDITERKKTEIELQKLASIVTHSSELINLATPDGNMVFLNEAGCRMLGIDPEKVSQFNIREVIPDELFPVVKTGILPALKRRETWEGELQYKNLATGELTDAYTMAFAITDPHSDVLLYFANISRDISERRQARRALEESEQKYRNIFEDALEGIFQSTPEGKMLKANPAFARMFGYSSPEEMITAVTNIGEQLYISPEDRKRLVRTLDEQGVAEGFETQLRDRHGNTIWISLNARAARDDNGKVLYYEGIVENITKRKQIEEELRQSHAMYRTIFDNSGTSIIIIDENTTIVLCNTEWEKISGFPREEVEGKMSWTEFIHPEDLAAMRNYHHERRSHAANPPRQYEFRYIDRYGNMRHMINTVAMIPGTKMSVAAQLDITDLKKAEIEKEKLQSQLLQSQKMEAVGTLAGGIAHDFNNILTALIGYGSLLQMNLGPDNPLTAYVNEMLSSSEKASQLTQSLLTFSRKQPVALKPLKLNDSVTGTQRLLKRLLTEDIVFDTRLTADDTTIMGDATQIDQIMLNLATNARDAMRQGGSLVIETRRREIDDEFKRAHGYKVGPYVQLTVSDTGSGMDRETREHIFDPFFTTKEVGKGTGLGLSTVYGIVKQHDGYIDLYSEPGKGTVFHIYLPAVKALAKEERPPSAGIMPGSETILVAEDNDAVRRLVRIILTRHGYTIIEAVDGKDAVEKFDANRTIDMAIIDSVMPKMNGREVYDRMRAANPHIKVLFMSGYTRDVVLDKGIEEKDFHYIAKPLSPNELLGKVREVLDGGTVS